MLEPNFYINLRAIFSTLVTLLFQTNFHNFPLLHCITCLHIVPVFQAAIYLEIESDANPIRFAPKKRGVLKNLLGGRLILL